jgi:hypothetical protein
MCSPFRIILTVFFTLFFALSGFAAPAPAAPANARTIKNLPGFPIAHLKLSLSPRLYKSLVISPVTAWVVASAPNMKGAEPKILRSDAGGAFDRLAQEFAKGWGSVGYDTTESRTQRPTLGVHLLVYRIADGLMAVNFAHNDQAFYHGRQHTEVWVGVYKDGKWTKVGGTKVIRNLTHPER